MSSEEPRETKEDVDKKENKENALKSIFASILRRGGSVVGNQVEMIRSLIKEGAKLDWMDENDNTPLKIAIASQNPQLMSVVFDTIPDSEINQAIMLNAKEVFPHLGCAFYLTPLGFAILTNNKEAVQNLIRRKADIEKIDVAGQTAINFALSTGNFNAAEELLMMLPKKERIERLQKLDVFSLSPLMWIYEHINRLRSYFIHFRSMDASVEELNAAEVVVQKMADNSSTLLSNIMSDFSEEEKIHFLLNTKLGKISLIDTLYPGDVRVLLKQLKPESRFAVLFHKKENGVSYMDYFMVQLTLYLSLGELQLLKVIKDSFNELPKHLRASYASQILKLDLLNFLIQAEGNYDEFILNLFEDLPKAKLDSILSLEDTSKSTFMTRIKEERWGIFKKLGAISPELLVFVAAKRLQKLHTEVLNLEKEHQFGRLRGKDESSIDESITNACHALFENILKRDFKSQFEGFGKNEAEQLQFIEAEIRKLILSRMIENYTKELEDVKNKKIEAEIKRISEILEFIDKNKDKILSLDESVREKTHLYFNSNTDSAQISWRAYDSSFPTDNWPNLLTEPPAGSESVDVFTTATSSTTRLNRKEASNIIRERAAYYFLAVMDKSLPEGQEDRIVDFLEYISIIRRAHNKERGDLVGRDDPSCFPGCITRLGLIGSKHPKIGSPIRKSPLQHVQEKMQAIIACVFTERLKSLTKENQEKLLDALTLLRAENAADIAKKPTQENYSAELLKLRDEFIGSLDRNKILDEVNHYLKEKKERALTSREGIYVDFAIENVGWGGITSQQLYDIYRSQIEISAETPELELKRLMEVEEKERKEEKEEKEKKETKEETEKKELENPFTIRAESDFPINTPKSIIERQIEKDTKMYFAFEEVFPILNRNKTLKLSVEELVKVTRELIVAYFATDPEADIKTKVEEAFKELKENVELSSVGKELEGLQSSLIEAFEKASKKQKEPKVTEVKEFKREKEGKERKESASAEATADRERKEEKEDKERQEPLRINLEEAIEEERHQRNALMDSISMCIGEFYVNVKGTENKYIEEKEKEEKMKGKEKPKEMAGQFRSVRERAREMEEKKRQEKGEGHGPRPPA